MATPGLFSAAYRALSGHVAALEALQKLQDACKEVGGFEKLAAEAEAKRNAAEQQLAATVKKIESANADLEGARKNAEKQREANAKAEADHRAAVEQIKAEGVEAGKRATAEANRIVEAARVEAAQIAATSTRDKEFMDDQLAGVKANVEAAKAELAETLQRKAEVEKEIDRLRSLFGGKV